MTQTEIDLENHLEKQWLQLENILKVSLPLKNHHSAEELKYIRTAFLSIEKQWEKTFSSQKLVKAVLIGEAPLYGGKKSYVLAEDAAETTFLRSSDFPNGSHDPDIKFNLRKMISDHGLVIVDAFPFALNAEDTPSWSYKGKSKSKAYCHLLRNSFGPYLLPKLQRIRARAEELDDFQIMVRYKRLVGGGLEQLVTNAQDLQGSSITCLGTTNMHVDQELFAKGLGH